MGKKSQKRSSSELLILSLSSIASIGIIPFGFYRLAINDIGMAFVDFLIGFSMLATFFYTYKFLNVEII